MEVRGQAREGNYGMYNQRNKDILMRKGMPLRLEL